jgi:LmbE family N-acetylglucosaminyl deacetylase
MADARKLRVLAVGAHPDDLEFQCGGTLARLVLEGHEVVMCHATDGEFGGRTDPATISARRAQEAQTAASVIGATCARLGLPECALSEQDPQQMRELTALVREVAPDLVVTHHPADYHEDHNRLATMVLDASFRATIPLHEAPGPCLAAAPAVFHMETVRGIAFLPDEYVDISAVIETKRAAAKAHASQLQYMAEHYGVDPLANVEVAARYRGMQSGVTYAEGFVAARRWPRLRAHRLLP